MSRFPRALLFAAGLNGALAMMAAAYGAHGVEAHPAQLIEKGSQFQLLHAVALLALALSGVPGRWLKAAALLFLTGIILFSGSLYLIALTGFGASPALPIGGSCFILGWCLIALGAFRYEGK